MDAQKQYAINQVAFEQGLALMAGCRPEERNRYIGWLQQYDGSMRHLEVQFNQNLNDNK